MDTREYLDMYIRKYYAHWLNYARYLCSLYNIRKEAYDCLADALEGLVRLPSDTLQDLIDPDLSDEKRLLYYIKGMVRYRVLRFMQRKYRRFVPFSEDIGTADDSGEAETTGDNFARRREVEALWRADDYVDPNVLYDGRETVIRFVSYVRKGSWCGPCVRYEAYPKGRRRRHFSTRKAAVAYLSRQEQSL